MKTYQKLQIASNILFLLGIGILIWEDAVIALAISILGMAKLLEESSQEKKTDESGG